MYKFLIVLGFAACLSTPAAAQDAVQLIAEADARLSSDREGSARSLLQDADRAIDADDDPLLRGELAYQWSRYWRWRRLWDNAAEAASSAHALFAENGADRDRIADAAYQSGYTQYRSGEIAAAHAAFSDALDIYAEDRDLFDPRRLRTNGWATMTRELAARLELSEGDPMGGVFIIASHATPADAALADAHGGVWAETDSPGFDVSAWHGRMDGFAIALIDAGPDGVPTNLRILESHPGDLWDLELEYALRRWRLDLSDPEARRTDIAITFVWAVQRYQR